MYYRVKKRIDRKKRITYVVQQTKSIIEIFFGIWEEYTKENTTLDEAIEQIKYIDSLIIEKKEIVYKITSKQLKQNA